MSLQFFLLPKDQAGHELLRILQRLPASLELQSVPEILDFAYNSA